MGGRQHHEFDEVVLDRLGVGVVSVCEPWLDTGGPGQSLLIAS